MAGKSFTINLGNPIGASLNPRWIDIGRLEGPMSLYLRNPDGDTVSIDMASWVNPGIESDSSTIATTSVAGGQEEIPLDIGKRFLRIRVTSGTGANLRVRLVGRGGSRFV